MRDRYSLYKNNSEGTKKQTIFKAIALLLVLITLVSHGQMITGASTSPTEPATTEAVNDTREPFRVGMECGYSPFNWTQMDSSNGSVPISGVEGQYANGYDVQIAKLIADKMGRRLEIVKLAWDGLIPALESGQIDAIAAGMSATEERLQVINFSDNYYYSDLVVVVQKDSPYAEAKKLEDFAGARLSAQQGTLHYGVIDQIEGVDKQTPLVDFPNLLVALTTGTIDGYVSERPGAMSASMANNKLTFIDFEEGEGFNFDDAEVSIGVGIKKNNPILLEVNQALTEIPQEQREQVMTDAIRLQPNEDADLSFFSSLMNIIKTYWKHFLKGAATTLFLAMIGTIIGLIVGLLIATFRVSPPYRGSGIRKVLHKLLSMILSIYVEVIRGTPMMVQAVVFYYGFRYATGSSISPLLAGIIILSFNTGAYMTEVVRGGIESVDKGQMEAGKTIGMTHKQVMRSVVLPQAIRNILPATGNEFVINIKDTSVFNVITVTELFFAARDVQANTLRVFESYLITAILYFVLTFTVTRILRAVERKMDGPANYTLTSSTTPATVDLHQKQGGN